MEHSAKEDAEDSRCHVDIHAQEIVKSSLASWFRLNNVQLNYLAWIENVKKYMYDYSKKNVTQCLF